MAITTVGFGIVSSGMLLCNSDYYGEDESHEEKIIVNNGGKIVSTTVQGGDIEVESGGEASDTTLEDKEYTYEYNGETYGFTAKGRMLVYGGSVSNTIANSGGGVYLTGGTAHQTSINSWGELHVSNGGVANNTTLYGGYVDVFEGGVVNNTIANAFVKIRDGGVANSTTVNSGGSMYISNGGTHRGSLQLNAGVVVSAYEGSTIDFTLTDRTPEDGYLINDLSWITGAPTYTITVSADQALGTYKLAQGASAFTGSITIGTETETYGTLTVNGAELNHQEATYSLVKEEGNLLLKIDQPAVFIYSSGTLVSSGSVVTGETLVEGMNDSMHISSGGVASETTVSSGGNMTIFEGGVANSTTVDFCGWVNVSSGGVANSTTVNSDGSMYISSGGVANSTTVNSWGRLYISSGGIANSTTVNSGDSLFISSGGIHRGSLQLESRAVVSAYEGSTIDFTLTDRTPEDGYLINDLSWITGAPTYTITVSADQALGTYKLAQGASSFSGSITIGTETENYGTLTVNGEALSYGNFSFNLLNTDGNLQLNVRKHNVIVSSGSVVSGTQIFDGKLTIPDGAVTSDTEVKSGGSMLVSSGGTANSTIVSSGGNMTIFEDGVASSTEVKSGGSMLVSGGVASDTLVSSGGNMTIFEGGVANSTTVFDGFMDISSGGVANDTVLEGGFLTVLSGGVANDTEMYYDAELNIAGGTANGVTMKELCSIFVSDGGVLNNLITDNTGGVVWVENGTVNQAVLLGDDDDDVDLNLESGCAANNTAVHYKGELYVSSGAVVSNTEITSGGEMFLHSGGVHRGGLQIESGAIVSAYRGAKIDFSLADKTAGNDYLINDLSLIRGTPTYTITISADQADGTYKLAQGASAFTGSITIGTETETYGTLTVNESALIYNEKQYSLTLNGSDLKLFISPPDSEAPVLEITGNATAWTNKNVVLTASASDSPSGISSVEYSFNNMSWTEGESVSVSRNGTVYFRATDNAGNITTQSVVVNRIDKTAPVAPVATADVTKPTNGEVTVTAEFSADSVVKEYSLNNKDWTAYTEGITFSEVGTVYFRGQDEAGNYSEVTSYTVSNIDTDAPVAPVAAADITAWTNGNVTISAAFSEDSIVKEYSLNNKDWQTYEDGVVLSANGTVYFRGQDEAGNYSEVTSYTVSNIDTDAPVAPVAAADITAWTNGNVTISAAFSEDSIVKEYSLNNKDWQTYEDGVVLSANGTVYFRGQDKAGNYSEVASYVVNNIDKTAPAAGRLTVKQQNQNKVLLTAGGFTDNNKIARYDFYLAGKKIGSSTNGIFTYNSTSNLTGTLNFSVKTADIVENISAAASSALPITVTVVGRATEKTTSIRWAAASMSGGVKQYEIRVSGMSKTFKSKTNSVTLKKLTAGNHTVTIYAINKAKQRVLVASGAPLYVNDITAPKGGKVKLSQRNQNSVLVTISGYKDNVKVARYDIYLNGRKVGSTTSNSYVYNGKNLAGSLKFSVRAFDAAGNAAKDKKATIKIKDATAPDRVVGLRVVGKANEKVTTLSWNRAGDNVGVTQYEIRVSGSSKVYKSKTTSVTIKKLSAGAHTFTVTAIDKAKNQSVVSQSVKFTVLDGTAPKGGKVSLSQLNANSVRVSISGFTDNVKVARYDIYLNGAKVGSTSTNSFTYKGGSALSGSLKFSVMAVDAAGNVSKAKKATLKIKAAPAARNMPEGPLDLEIGGIASNSFARLPDERNSAAPGAALKGFISGTAGADVVEFAADLSRYLDGMSLGAGNDTVILEQSGTPSVVDVDPLSGYGLMDLGAGNDLVRLEANTELESALDLGLGNDTLIIEKGATLDLDIAGLDFGAGSDKLILDGVLELDCGTIRGLESITGKGELIISGDGNLDDDLKSKFKNAGIEVTTIA